MAQLPTLFLNLFCLCLSTRQLELDSWMYNTTRYGAPVQGPSMVCCVFVCRMWLAGGLFNSIDNELQCAEQVRERVRGGCCGC